MGYLPAEIVNADQAESHPVERAAEIGKELTADYAAGDPFPHIVIDDFLPEGVVDLCLSNFPGKTDSDSMSFDRNQERFKTSFHPDNLEPSLRSLFYAFNSRPFIRVVENITGISGLIPDPDFLGGGFHEINTGGHLSMHADFNHHKRLDLERRVNVLIYLNHDWKEEYGGQLELWRTDMSERVQSIVPVANRCVMFTTTASSMHGNPQPVSHPDGVSRKSIALYYYTATWDTQRPSKTTQFKPRPGTEDRVDWQVRSDEFFGEVLPPVVWRKIKNLRHRLKSKG